MAARIENLRPCRRQNTVSGCLPESKRLESCPHSNQKKKVLCMPRLPQEIVFNILLCLPADILYNVMRYVCREWYNVIRDPVFANAHVLKSDRGSLIWTGPNRLGVPYVELMKPRDLIEMTRVRFPDFGGMLVSSCNGLVCYTTVKRSYYHYIANPVTKEIVRIPTASEVPWISCLGYTSSSKEYKLVEFNGGHERLDCGILTLGVDKEWRFLDATNQTLKIKRFLIEVLVGSQVATDDGFVHLPHYSFNLTLDLESETFFLCSVPNCSNTEREDMKYFGTGRSLCFMDRKGKFSWELWLLKNVPTGDWTKLATIDLGSQEQWLRQSLCPQGFRLGPIGWLKDGEIAIFHVNYDPSFGNLTLFHDAEAQPLRNCIAYNVKTGAMNSYQLDEDDNFYSGGSYVPHVKSLVSLEFATN
ncbi:putative F-box protein At3g52320 [Coffea arabica]|uniref:F-box protein At3g52320 n=1 Tax=Coffea arabica TaxID=13443 RepID=A0A6P6SVI6_COFAR|nr:F-box protein At3g07870-like [Coffea arabica]